MSSHVEWVDAADATRTLGVVDPDEFADAHGTRLDPGNHGIAMDCVVIEGTYTELMALAHAIGDTAHAAEWARAVEAAPALGALTTSRIQQEYLLSDPALRALFADTPTNDTTPGA